MTHKVLLSLAAVMLLLALDRYSRGYGGEAQALDWFAWQVVAAAGLGALLVSASVAALRGRWDIARKVLIAEGALFLVLNVFLVSRDGMWRFVWGFEHSALGLLVVIGGVLLRFVLLRYASTAIRPGVTNNAVDA